MAKQDIQQQVTDQFIAALEAGTKPWTPAWSQNGLSVMPHNLATGSHYSGINILLLFMAAHVNSFTTQAWLTYNQAKAMGGQVRKGEKGTACVFYKNIEKTNKETGEDEKFFLASGFTVFNIEQIDGIDYKASVDVETIGERYSRVQAFVEATGINIRHGFQSPCYQTIANTVSMPAPKEFHTEADYWATLFHEISHATGHSTRLDRNMGARGTPEYAFEEIIVEMASSMLMGHFGITGDVQHESYVAGWLGALRNDKRYIFKAAAAANKIFEYFKQFDSATEEEQQAA